VAAPFSASGWESAQRPFSSRYNGPVKIAAWCPSLIVLLLAAGCGGPSANEQRARWARDADAVCAKAEREIASHGAPATGPGYVRDVSADAGDARDAIRRVLALDVPQDSGNVQAARASLKQLDADLRTLAGIDANTPPNAVVEMIDDLQDSAEDVADPARAAGLRTCGRARSRDVALDAMKAPVFAIQFNVYAADLVKKLAHLRDGADTRRELEDALIGYALAIGDAQNELDRMRAPRWALSDVDDYKDVVLDLRTAVGDTRTALMEHKAVGPKLSRVDRAERTHLRAALALQRRLERGTSDSPGDDPA